VATISTPLPNNNGPFLLTDPVRMWWFSNRPSSIMSMTRDDQATSPAEQMAFDLDSYASARFWWCATDRPDNNHNVKAGATMADQRVGCCWGAQPALCAASGNQATSVRVDRTLCDPAPTVSGSTSSTIGMAGDDATPRGG
jgi:hypothetical protein